MQIRVHFKEVGRGKSSWSADFSGESHNGMPTEQWMLKQVKRHLLSRDISFGLDEDGGGFVFAGDRAVGTFQIDHSALN